jgi:hypothetical protein
MLDKWFKRLCIALPLCASGMLFAAPASSELTAEQIVQAAVQRAQWAGTSNPQRNYNYDKTSIVEELDGKGRVKSRKEKFLQFESGVGTLKELKVDGKPATLPEVKKQEAQTISDRQHIAPSKTTRRDDNWCQYLTGELISRYNFVLVGSEEIGGRAAYVLTFEPKNDHLPVKEMTDRLINRLAGKVWVDANQFEVAKAEIRLLDEVSLWGGLIAALRKFSFNVERTPVDKDVWMNQATKMELEGRKLFDTMRMRIKSESGNFRRPVAFNSHAKPIGS